MSLFLVGINVAISTLLGHVLVIKHTPCSKNHINHKHLLLYLCVLLVPVIALLASTVHLYLLFLAEIILNENLTRSFFTLWAIEYITLIALTLAFIKLKQYVRTTINQKKKAAEQLRLAAISFESHKGIMITDKNFNVLQINKAFTEITGYSEKQIIGKSTPINYFNRYDPLFNNDIKQQLKENGRYEGEVWNQKKNGDIYPEWQTITAIRQGKDEVSHFVCVFSDITEKKHAENIMYEMAYYDPLTKIPNRHLFINRFDQELATSKRHNQFGAVIFLDLDHFKHLNDTQGHLIGDQLLKEVGARLLSVLREEDTPARLGGDEFVILLHANTEHPNIAKNQAWTVANKIKDALNEPFIIEQCRHKISSSIGITLFPDHNKSSQAILHQADTAMYSSKAEGRNTISFFNPDNPLKPKDISTVSNIDFFFNI